MKKETVKYNRKIKRAWELGRQLAIREMLKLIPISQQVLNCVDAGMDVTIKCEISAKELLKIVRN